MADIPLKSFTFPGLSDRYTTPVVDNTLAVAGAAADAKKTGDEIGAIKNDLNQFPNGNYPQMGAGYANQLVSGLKKEDSTPYNFRAVPYDATLEEVEKIVGGTIAWKQLIQNGNFASGTDNWQANNGTLSAQNGVLTYVRGSDTGSNQIFQFVNATVNHVLFGSAIVRVSTSTSRTISMRIGDLENTLDYSVTPNTWTEITTIKKANINNPEFNIYGRITNEWSEGDTVDIKECMCFDIAQMFGTSIADYVYSLEAATAGAGVAWLKTHFPAQFDAGYQAYDAGTLKSIGGLSGKKTVGFNQWDEELEVGNINATTGQNETGSVIRSKNYIPVLPNTVYYANVGTGTVSNFVWFEYDADKNYLGQQKVVNDGHGVFTTSANAHYIRFRLTSGYSTTYNHDICINLSDPTKNGTYKPYEAHSYALDSDVVLRGIPKLDSNNQLYYDGDEYLPDGTVNRRYREIDFDGNEGWTLQSINSSGIANFVLDLGANNKYTNGPHAVCNRFKAQITSISETTEEGFILSAPQYLYIRISSSKADTVTGFKTWLASNPTQLMFELATPTTETADPYQTPQIIAPDGTEEYIYEDGAFELPVGHSSDYPVDVSGQLDDILDTPSANGTYTLKATVTDGAVTYSWVADA